MPVINDGVVSKSTPRDKDKKKQILDNKLKNYKKSFERKDLT